MSVVLSWLGWTAATLGLTGVQLGIIARHPEPPADEPDVVHKIRYADLITTPAILAALVGTLICSLLVVLFVPDQLRPVWLVWSSAALVLVAVDARTTWLPIRASRFATGCLLVAMLVTGALDRPQVLLGAVLGGALAGGLFALLWWLTGALGFGDVRLAAMAGGLTGLGSIELWYTSLLAASIVGACWGLAVRLWRRRHPSPLGKAFAYGPGLWLGPWLGQLWLVLTAG
ncbi:MAG: prepilin peptidase [Brooklawnia sp.]|uniref:prepilin peptidase n=1 Tax=Brooklawnia sp. TaxID=2699740 RepID=UPI003C74365D